MTSKELREGNWLRYADHEKVKPERRGKEFQIIPDDIVFLSENPDYEYVHAIHLTEEWLMRFGKLAGNKTYRIDVPAFDLWIEIYWYEYSATGNSFSGWLPRKVERKVNMSLDPPRKYFEQRTDIFMIGYFDYVHELQNWYFTLTKTELSIQTSSPAQS